VDLVTLFKDESGKTLGSLTVTLRFDFLIRDMRRLGWWQTDQACLVDESGTLLARTDAMETRRERLGETGDSLERAVVKGISAESNGTILGPGHPPETVAGYARLENAPWALVLFAPGRTVLEPIVRYRFYYVVAGGLSIVLVLVLIRLAVGRITESVSRLSRVAQKVAEGRYGPPLPVRTGDEIGHLTRSFNAMVDGLRERDVIRNTFGRYMDEDIARELMRRPEAHRLEGEKRQVAVLMSDIRGFTPLAETLNPEATLRILNLYFSHMIEVIKRHRGIIVDFVGDGILVFFDPLDGPLSAALERAVQCALDMQSEMTAVRGELAAMELPHLETGIGVNAGPVVVGTVGSETRAKYGIVGSTVNLTQRIQTEAGPGETILSQAVVSGIGRCLILSRSFEVRPRGVSRPLTLHALKGWAESGTEPSTEPAPQHPSGGSEGGSILDKTREES
jgi:class 3 adenylate cyclase